jgi:WD40 repeat protein
VTSRAEALYAELDNVGQEVIRRLFLRLITVGEVTGDSLSAPDTRRRVLRAELTSLDGRPTTTDEGPRDETSGSSDVRPSSALIRPSSIMDTVVDQYGRHRLLTFDRDPVTRGPTVEVAHEALIREWGRLRRWLDEDRELLLWQQRLRAGLHQWEASEQDEGALLRGAPLAEAENWFNHRQVDLSEAERNFIQASIDLREQRAAEREARRQRELEAAQKLAEEQARTATIEKQRAQDQARSNKRLRWLAIGLVVFLVGAIGAAFLAVRGTQRAEQQTRLTTAREIAGLAINNLAIDPERSILLALQAVDATYAVDGTVTREAEEALHQAVQTSRTLWTLVGHDGPVAEVDLSPDGTRLATASFDGTAKVWDTTTGQELLTLTGHDSIVFDVVFNPDGSRLATGCYDGTAKVWDAQTGQELLTLAGHTAEVFGLAFSPDGTRLASASFDGTAKVWDTRTGQEFFTLSGHSNDVNEVAFSPDGTRIATTSADLTAKVWNAATGKELLTLAGHTVGPPGRTYTGITGVAFSPDGSRLATAGDDGTVRMWDTATGQELLAMVGTGEEPASNTAFAFGGVVDVVFSSDGTYLATAAADGTARVWDATTGESLLTLANDIGLLSDVAISPDGAHLIAASWETGMAKVWDISTALETGSMPGQPLSVLSSDAGTIYGVAYSLDGLSWAMANPGTAKIFEATTDQELLTLPDQGDGIFDVAFSPDGTRLATAGKDGHVRLYVLPIEELVDLAQSRLTRTWTTEECQQFLHLDECP